VSELWSAEPGRRPLLQRVREVSQPEAVADVILTAAAAVDSQPAAAGG
jgi:hypothetical protein